ncbi:hypothetical protein [Marinifilum sp. D714]|uniref:hypothetical protein n=1 Tax=Marinifilum sp. D714 TaxID=2937523 RepID=UPI0027C02735|nr:hypothetical protein [Marinifilum sp. D714]MDQ2178548.1 hypothetical protein [Marinifilum sp. D714]
MKKRILLSSFLILFLILLLVTGLIPFDIYLLPMTLCGLITLIKIGEKLEKNSVLRETFFYVWCVLFLSSFVAPLIHFSRNYWIENVYYLPTEWNGLAFKVSSIYLFGIIVFAVLDNVNLFKAKQLTYIRQFKASASYIVLFLMSVSFILQTYLYIRVGGISQYMLIFTEKNEESGGFAGMGAFFIISEIFPYLLMLYFFIKNRGKQVSFIYILLFLALMLISCIYFGGLRGSRSNTIFTMLQAVIVINFTIYRFSKIHFMGFLAGFFLFMAIGRLYKNDGINLVNNIGEYQSLSISEDMTSMEKIVTGDLARFNIMCYELFMLKNNSTYKKKYGSTYLYSIFTFIPGGKNIREYLNLTGRSEAAGNLQFDFDGQIRSAHRKNTRIFGFVGEFMLNFGSLSFVFAFLILLVLLKYIESVVNSVWISDPMFILVALLPIFISILINADFNNFVFSLIKRVIPLYFIIMLITKKSSRRILR